jgi:xanthine/uracil/vitamin C permease (AzgA family)
MPILITSITCNIVTIMHNIHVLRDYIPRQNSLSISLFINYFLNIVFLLRFKIQATSLG